MNRERGFSLVELLIAVSLMAIIALALYQLFSVGLKAREMGESYNVTTVKARTILNRLENTVRNLTPFGLYFGIEPGDTVGFPCLLPDRDQEGRKYLKPVFISYFVDEDTTVGKSDLIEQVMDFDAGKVIRNVLGPEIDSLKVLWGYYDPDEPLMVFSEDYDPEASPPVAVRFSLALQDPSGRSHLFERVVPLNIPEEEEEAPEGGGGVEPVLMGEEGGFGAQ